MDLAVSEPLAPSAPASTEGGHTRPTFYAVGVDTGGTFTDCVIVADDGRISCDKALTTPADLTQGVLQALTNAAKRLGLTLEALLANTRFIAHGTTQGLNRLCTRTGARVGLVTTRGHEDALFIGRVAQKVAGLGAGDITRAAALRKPAPLVPRPLVRGVPERVDCDGDVVVPLDVAAAVRAVDDLVSHGVESIAIALLWSFMNPAHEIQLKHLVQQRHPNVFVTVSSELAPLLGEYERIATTVINAYLAPATHQYLLRLEEALQARRLNGPLLIMQSAGGVIPAAEASQSAVQIVSSGPAGGVIGAALLGRVLGRANLITTDVGGTSFDVGLVLNGEPVLASQPTLDQYSVHTPSIDVRSIGAGGGSVAWCEQATGLLRVGPLSAGSDPGPVCYGRGGLEPTVTDANLILGRIDGKRFFAGRMELDVEAARTAILERIARPLGISVEQAAQGILDIVDAHMADLVRTMTIERGYDPREFTLCAFGGGGPVHVGSYAQDLQVKEVLISPYAPMFSALGMASAGITRYFVRAQPGPFPFDPLVVNPIFRELEERARSISAANPATGIGAMTLRRFVDLRYRFQVHELRVPVPEGELHAGSLRDVMLAFEALYQDTYGQGTILPGAAVEVVNYGVVVHMPVDLQLLSAEMVVDPDPSAAQIGQREVYFRDRYWVTPIFAAWRLRPGNVVRGPAVIEDTATTTVVHPGQRVEIDPYRNQVLRFHER